jgi:hypothetical protein
VINPRGKKSSKITGDHCFWVINPNPIIRYVRFLLTKKTPFFRTTAAEQNDKQDRKDERKNRSGARLSARPS